MRTSYSVANGETFGRITSFVATVTSKASISRLGGTGAGSGCPESVRNSSVMRRGREMKRVVCCSELELRPWVGWKRRSRARQKERRLDDDNDDNEDDDDDDNNGKTTRRTGRDSCHELLQQQRRPSTSTFESKSTTQQVLFCR